MFSTQVLIPRHLVIITAPQNKTSRSCRLKNEASTVYYSFTKPLRYLSREAESIIVSIIWIEGRLVWCGVIGDPLSWLRSDIIINLPPGRRYELFVWSDWALPQ